MCYRDEAQGGTPRALRADIAFPHLQAESVSPRGSQHSPRTGSAGSKAGEQERRLTAIVHRHMKELLCIVAGSSTSVRISSAQVDAMGIVLMAPFNSEGHGRRLSQLLPWWRSGGHEAVSVSDVSAWLQEALPHEPPHRAGAAAGNKPGHVEVYFIFQLSCIFHITYHIYIVHFKLLITYKYMRYISYYILYIQTI